MKDSDLWNILTAWELYIDDLERWKYWTGEGEDVDPPMFMEDGGNPFFDDGTIDYVQALNILLAEDNYKLFLKSYPSDTLKTLPQLNDNAALHVRLWTQLQEERYGCS